MSLNNPGVRRERYDVALMRACLRNWPVSRGRWFFARLCQGILRNRDFVMEVEPGLFVPGDLEDWVQLWCFMGEFPGGDESAKLSRTLIRSGDTVLDVGANVGLWALGAAKSAGSSGRVQAFEPVPELFERLTRNLKFNGLERVRCFRTGLSDKAGSATFYRDATGNSGRGALVQHEGLNRGIDIPLTTLDEHAAANGLDRIDFMKVDVEGAELRVFRGAERVLSGPQAPIVLFECSEVLTAPFGTTSAEIKALLVGRGYRTYRVLAGRLQPVSIEDRHDKIEDLLALQPRHFEMHSELDVLRRAG